MMTDALIDMTIDLEAIAELAYDDWAMANKLFRQVDRARLPRLCDAVHAHLLMLKPKRQAAVKGLKP